ncbi:MAG TPA: phosphate ABC transporter substrate-binding protein PstS [Solirubrobacteraceae bacterium]|nr:phosphate ABC transporter substrate-binding protein PstS [Solirubrobacteraceae bacterium]
MKQLDRFTAAVVVCGSLAVGVAACGSSNDNGSSSTGGSASTQKGGTINGAGATFPQPVYSEWAARFKDKQGTTVNYDPVGSGGGVAQFQAGTVDFGASDAAMKDSEIKVAQKKGDPVHVPTVLGAVTVSYNVSGLKTGLKLDGATIADMFLGKVTSWNDKEIAATNPGVTLPSTTVAVCHRSDSSGTTKNFTQFLADYSKAWASGPGVDKSVKWANGTTGAKGNDGVAACVKQTDGAVGYVEQAYALQNNFATASVKNKEGKFVAPTLPATSAAGVAAKPPADLRFSTIDAPGATTYPITAVTFLLVYQDMCKAGMDATKAGLVKDWLDYALGDGQAVAAQLQYAKLPPAILAKAKAKVAGLQCNGTAIAG